jgi:hypothetical protein
MKTIYADLLLDALRKTADSMEEAGDSYIDVAAGIRIAMRAVEAQDDVWRRVSDAGYPRESGTYLCRYRFEGSEDEYFGSLDYLAEAEIPHFQYELGAGGLKVTHWCEKPELEEEA